MPPRRRSCHRKLREYHSPEQRRSKTTTHRNSCDQRLTKAQMATHGALVGKRNLVLGHMVRGGAIMVACSPGAPLAHSYTVLFWRVPVNLLLNHMCSLFQSHLSLLYISLDQWRSQGPPFLYHSPLGPFCHEFFLPDSYSFFFVYKATHKCMWSLMCRVVTYALFF